MRQIFFILFLSINLLIIGQTCQTINEQVVNCTDSKGQKQGYWIVRDSIADWSCEDCRSFRTRYRYILKEKGNYLNDKKVGIWNYYAADIYGSDEAKEEKTISYLDKGITKEINYQENYLLELNNDSSIIAGSFPRNQDTISVSCKNKMCNFTLKQKIIVTVAYTTFNAFYFDILRIQIGMYDRKIKELKRKP